MGEPIIQLRHLTKRFGGGDGQVHALEDVSIDVGAGEIFGVIGLSGAGKSTLVRCINLLERPTDGEVIVDGQSMTALSEKQLREARKSIGMIFQSFNLLMQRTALDNICFPMELAGVPRREAQERGLELLRVVDLESRAGAYPSQLSGGQKQRVAIARHQPQGAAVRRGHQCPGPQDHQGHPAPHPGHQPAAGHHGGGHHPRDEGHRGDLLPGGHPGPGTPGGDGGC